MYSSQNYLALLSVLAVSVFGQEPPPKTLATCMEIIKTVPQKMHEFKMQDINAKREFMESCNDIRSCAPFYEKPNGKPIDHTVNRTLNFCDGVTFLTADFLDCQAQLDEACLNSWEPFPNIEQENNLKKKIMLRKEACNHFYGEDECIKAQVKERCGEDKWNKLNEKIMMLNDDLQACPTARENGEKTTASLIHVVALLGLASFLA